MRKYAKFSLEPVGQGLFYTGKIGNFNLVYDCGELNGPNKIIDLIRDYKNRLGSSRIDMLIVSHLHWDHVCGFEELMKNTQVRYVFLLTRAITEPEHYDNNIIEKNRYIKSMRKAVFQIMEVSS